MEHIVIEARGEYPFPVKPELLESLLASIAAHMKAYGLKEITVEQQVSPVSPPPVPAGSEPSGPRPDRTWDQSPSGAANSSVVFDQIRNRIAVMIRGSAFSLINGRSEDVAHTILAQLTHGEFKMGPHQPELCEALEAVLTPGMPDRLTVQAWKALEKANPNRGTDAGH